MIPDCLSPLRRDKERERRERRDDRNGERKGESIEEQIEEWKEEWEAHSPPNGSNILLAAASAAAVMVAAAVAVVVDSPLPALSSPPPESLDPGPSPWSLSTPTPRTTSIFGTGQHSLFTYMNSSSTLLYRVFQKGSMSSRRCADT